jgi:hypothetical protein
MSTPSEETIERTKVREAAAIFHSRRALDAAVDALLLAGFDRADADIIADLGEAQRIGPAYVAPEELADINRVPRRPVIEPEDIAGTVAFLAAGAVIFAVMHSGGSAGMLTYRRLVPEKSQSLERQMAALGLILWVRVRLQSVYECPNLVLVEEAFHESDDVAKLL